MYNLLHNIRSLLPRKLLYCDVGARWGMGEPWNSFRDVIGLVSFEPDKEEFDSLVKKQLLDDILYPFALFSESRELPLNLTRSRGCSSLYRPNHEFLKYYPDSQRFDVEDTVMVQTASLDSLYMTKIVSGIDFIKIDVQGAELDILRGGEKFLRDNILGIEVEVEFHSMYENQPLFSDVDIFVRESLGLHIQDLRKTYWKFREGTYVSTTKGQLIFGDALYFRSPQDILSWCSRFETRQASEKLQLACLMGIVYGYLDYSLCLLNQPSLSDFLDEDIVNSWRSLIHHHGKALKFKGKGAGKLSNLLNLLYRMFQPVHEGWASAGHHLGSRKKYGIFG